MELSAHVAFPHMLLIKAWAGVRVEAEETTNPWGVGGRKTNFSFPLVLSLHIATCHSC